MTIAYRERNGRVEKRIVHNRNGPQLRGESRPDQHFSRGLLRAYYELECKQGTSFRSTYPKSVIKKVHETAIQRFEQTGKAT